MISAAWSAAESRLGGRNHMALQVRSPPGLAIAASSLFPSSSAKAEDPFRATSARGRSVPFIRTSSITRFAVCGLDPRLRGDNKGGRDRKAEPWGGARGSRARGRGLVIRHFASRGVQFISLDSARSSFRRRPGSDDICHTFQAASRPSKRDQHVNYAICEAPVLPAFARKTGKISSVAIRRSLGKSASEEARMRYSARLA